MLKFLLDTDIAIHTIRNRPDPVRARFTEHAEQLAISTVTVGELVYGAEKSSRPTHNLSVVESFAARLVVLPFDEPAAHHFGQLRAELRRAGHPIGPYDMMIAGHARSAGLILVTKNTREFQRVPGLRVENWA